MIDVNNTNTGGTTRKPNYTLRRVKFTLAVVALTASATLLLTWRTTDSPTISSLTGLVFLASAVWLAIRFLPRDGER